VEEKFSLKKREQELRSLLEGLSRWC